MPSVFNGVGTIIARNVTVDKMALIPGVAGGSRKGIVETALAVCAAETFEGCERSQVGRWPKIVKLPQVSTKKT